MSRAEACALLDWVRAGGDASDEAVLLALWISGDLRGPSICAALDAPC